MEIKSESVNKISTDEVFKLVMRKQWQKISDLYQNKALAPNMRITQSKETALHVAVSSLHTDEEALLIMRMIECASPADLKMRNESGDTPLHLAATAGWKTVCERIAKKDKALIRARNNAGETPLFVAAHHGKHEAFLSLHEAYLEGENPERSKNGLVPLFTRSEDGNTILHSAIAGEYFRLANWIIHNYEILSSRKNVDGETPLHFLARKPNVFKSSNCLRPIQSLVYRCVLIEKMKSTDCFPRVRNGTTSTGDVDDDLKYPPNYRTCVSAFGLVKSLVKICISDLPGRKNSRGLDGDEENQNHGEHMIRDRRVEEKPATVCPGEETKHKDLFPSHCATCVFFFYFVMKVILTVLGLGFWMINKIKDEKRKNVHAEQVMKYLIDSTSTYQYGYDGLDPDDQMLKYPRIDPDSAPPVKPIDMDDRGNNNNIPKNFAFPQLYPNPDADGTNSPMERAEKQDTPILIAVKNGISEMVEEIFSSVPISIHDTDSKGKNLLLAAAENRQTAVLRFLLKKNPPEYVAHRVDNDGNGILHLAAKLEENFHPWKIPGAALQMQRELIWYKYVKNSFPALCAADENANGEIPSKIFTDTHEKLVKEGAEWLRKTSESCSVIAALIAGVAFATSSSIPGGTDEKTGLPKLQGSTNFDIFSVASLLALCLSVTSLVCFLAIVTSRFEEKKFRMNLPVKLMLGLSCLFMSIAAMLVCFSAGHSFILGDKMRIASLPIYMTVSIPLMIFLVAQLPLYVDLLRATVVSVPLRSYKL